MNKSIISIVALALLGAAPALAGSVASLRPLCPEGGKTVLAPGTRVDGVVVSDYRSLNMELNPNLNYYTVDLNENDRTAYLQDADGAAGVRLVFDEPTDNQLQRYDRVSLDLGGCTLERDSSPDRITVRGLTNLNVVEYGHGTAEGVAVKEKFINELTPADMYTLVTLKDAEFIFKDGSYADIYEGYAMEMAGYTYNKYAPNRRMDGWASLVRDSRGGTIYMLVNTGCTWRRDGRGVPQGVGPLSGIIVNTPMRRYGGDMGPYSIRPMDETDINIPRRQKSSWKTLTGWHLDGSNGQSLEFEIMGVQTGMFKNGKKGDRLVSDCGSKKGFFWTDSDSFIHIDSDLNGLTVDGRGTAINAAVMLKGKTSGWFSFAPDGKTVQECKSIFVEFDASKIKGTDMAFSFSWLAGSSNANNNYNYPGVWKVQMTCDNGASWVTLKEIATGNETVYLRTHPWWDKKLSGIPGKKRTGYDCGLGMQQRSFAIPPVAFGKTSVILRLTPAAPLLAAIRSKPAKNVMDPASKPSLSSKNMTLIRFGAIYVDYK